MNFYNILESWNENVKINLNFKPNSNKFKTIFSMAKLLYNTSPLCAQRRNEDVIHQFDHKKHYDINIWF